MALPELPREAAQLISSLSNHVKINEENIEKLGDVLIEEIKSGSLSPKNFSQTDVHPNPEDPWALDWLLVVDTLNFCFWSKMGRWEIDGYTGYFALCAAINRALREKVDILNPKFYSVITEEQLQNILRSDNGQVQCPLLPERIKCLHEVGKILLENFDGTFATLVKRAEGSAAKLLTLIVNNFKCFRDEAIYKGHKVAIYKRAQILVGDIWSCYRNEGIGYFQDIDIITAFADYRVPQTLLWHGILEYSEELLKKLNADEILKNGEEMEVEIRGCTIHAVELLTAYARTVVGTNINSVLVDHFLWEFRRKHAKEVIQKKIPFHKTYSIYY